MSFMIAPNRDMGIEIGDIAGLHDIRITLTVQNHEALWDAASAKLNSVGLTDEDIADCIGTRADISLGDCLTTLVMPLALPGCALTDVSVRALVPDLDRLLMAATEAFRLSEEASLPACADMPIDRASAIAPVSRHIM
ncbi:hypothetical protein HL653_06155 [Sphingomonas sp. AP4-R1]|uniref:hypothetical protein n=1 Tax=Sphingomonas sp. AP4-R1 TaxID=2735134 RepID=UPI0014934A04|nr:hypothetical protein [Sphingomonas sp. AP4-R1]QJU57431.1 hypothetical protein HL653_06155 [Sphingomonas sp. AP4-R1]